MSVSAAALRARTVRARAASSERYDCCATFWRDLVLLAGDLDLRPALVVLALRDHLLFEQRRRCGRTRPRRRSSDALAFMTSGTWVAVEGLPRREPEALASICAALASASCELRRCFRRRNAGEDAALRDARAALDRRLDDAAGRLGADLRLLVGAAACRRREGSDRSMRSSIGATEMASGSGSGAALTVPDAEPQADRPAATVMTAKSRERRLTFS